LLAHSKVDPVSKEEFEKRVGMSTEEFEERAQSLAKRTRRSF
jgi:hypothetical protein